MRGEGLGLDARRELVGSAYCGCMGLGFGVCGTEVGVRGLGVAWGLGFGVWFRVWGLGFRVWGLGFRV